MIALMFITALSLSAIAAFYSIAGLAAIFSAAVVPIVVMGSILEVSKLVVASWLYRNWSAVPKLLKSYFTVALLILMMLTSMGIFGFLSKAHLDQAVPTGDVAAKIALIDEKIKTERGNIEEARKTLAQLDSQVDQTLSRTAKQDDDSGVTRSIKIRKNQAKERKSLYAAISDAQTQIAKLNEERAPIATQLRKVEAEVGPVKYIAALIYGDNLDQNLLEKAVRWVIIMIVSVFDPLAVLMLIAANWSLANGRKKDEPKYELDDGPLTTEQIDQIIEESGVVQEDPEPKPVKIKTEKKFFESGKKIAKKIDDEFVWTEENPFQEESIDSYNSPAKPMGRFQSELLARQAKTKK